MMKSMRNEAVVLLSPASLPPFKQKLRYTPAQPSSPQTLHARRSSYSLAGGGNGEEGHVTHLWPVDRLLVAVSDVLCCPGQPPEGRLPLLGPAVISTKAAGIADGLRRKPAPRTVQR